MKKKINIGDFQYNPQEMARQFMIVISRGGGAEILEHARQILLAIVSRADKPEVFQPLLKLFTVMKDGYDVNIEKTTQLQDQATEDSPATEKNATGKDLAENILPKGSVKYLRRLKKLGLLDDDLQLIKEPKEKATTRSEAMYIALRTCNALDLEKTQWKPFQEFWNIDNLAQEKWKWENRRSMSPRRKVIDKAFEDY